MTELSNHKEKNANFKSYLKVQRIAQITDIHSFVLIKLEDKHLRVFKHAFRQPIESNSVYIIGRTSQTLLLFFWFCFSRSVWIQRKTRLSMIIRQSS